MVEQGKDWVLVTGACGGIGTALVDVFTDHGCNVVATDQYPSDKGINKAIEYVQLDLSLVAESAKYLDEFSERLSALTSGLGIRFLINNAATQLVGAFDQIDRQQWHESFAINLTSPFFLIQRFAASLSRNRGAVVNISSIHAQLTKPDFLAYATSKAALSALTRNLAVSIGSAFRVNAIEPAAVATPMLVAGLEDSPEKLDALAAFHPIGRIATPNEIARIALYLCTEDASFIHGETISASGGIDHRLHDPG